MNVAFVILLVILFGVFYILRGNPYLHLAACICIILVSAYRAYTEEHRLSRYLGALLAVLGAGGVGWVLHKIRSGAGDAILSFRGELAWGPYVVLVFGFLTFLAGAVAVYLEGLSGSPAYNALLGAWFANAGLHEIERRKGG